MNNTSCSVFDASTDNNKAGFYQIWANHECHRAWYISGGRLVINQAFTERIAWHGELPPGASQSCATGGGEAFRMPSLPNPAGLQGSF